MRRGFTMLEMLLVLAVVLVMAAVAAPSMEALQADSRLYAAADIIRARWADARARAAEDGIAYRFGVVQQTGRFRVAPDAGEFWSGDGPATPETDVPPLVLEDTLPRGVAFADAANPTGEGGGDFVPLVTFLPDGTARENVAIAFRAGSGRALILRLRALTGAVTVERESVR
jgi:prepilin-type N-terminal cleavage/methylation domain-containing protein